MARKVTSNIPETTQAKLTVESQEAVFISHVHEDEPLAEAFAILIQSVSAGAIPTLRSSSKTLGEGIQYGEEWFRWICESVNAASHTVALVTPASTGRPWILFEAGLGKARPDGTVFGVALGIPREDAYKGPFGVLQNCGAEKNELKKLCKQLIQGKNLNPPEEMIERCVDDFQKKVDDHFKTAKAGKGQPEEKTTIAVFQALEEMKLMLRDQEQMYREGRDGTEYRNRRKRRMLHPMMLEEMSTMVSDGSDDPIGLLLLASVFKDDFPPFYEMALETYRTIKVGDMPSGEAIARLMRFAEIMAHSPFRDDISMNSKELHMMMMDLPEFISRIGRRLLVKKPATKVIRGLRKDLIK